jgi:hypothetical protein
VYFTIGDTLQLGIYASKEEAKEDIFKMICKGWKVQGTRKWLERHENQEA